MKQFLIVTDMQKDFVDGALGSKDAQAIVENVVQKIASFDGKIIATLDTHTEQYLESREGRYLPVIHCVRGTDGWKLEKRVEEALRKTGAVFVEKNGFASVELPGILKNAAGGEAFATEVIGLCTDVCVVSNAFLIKSFFPEYPISVDASCCAGITPEGHRAALITMKSCQIDIKGE